ncbi:MAG TPA: hypothetical protein VNT75_21355 [Symbiobacteriaceae bacterium]|nr:hypothetical protein [Symbiobacteriaceae bacterium]
MNRHRPVLIFLVIAVSVFGTWVFTGRAGADRPLKETLYLTLWNLDLAGRDLEQAATASSPERRAEAMARAQGHLVSAMHAVDRTAHVLFPDFPPPPEYLNLPTTSNNLLNVCTELTPEMTAGELTLRREMLVALQSGILKGIDGNWTGPDWSVDRKRLIREWQAALKPYEVQERNTAYFVPPEGPIPATVTTARLPDGRLEVKVDWERSYRVFPRPQQHFLVIYSRVSDVKSTAAPKQDALGRVAAYDSFTAQENPFSMLDWLKLPSAREMQTNTFTVIGVLEGLPQTLTMTVQSGEARIFFAQHRAGRHMKTIQLN